MSHSRTPEALIDNDFESESSDANHDIDDLLATAATNIPRRRWRSILAVSRRDRRKIGADAEMQSSDSVTDTADPDAVDAATPGHDATHPDTTVENSAERPRLFTRTQALAFIVLPLLAMAAAAGIGYLKYVNAVGEASQQAARQSVQAAKDSTVAMLSYSPETVDKQLTAATDRMTGSFRESYSSLIHDVVIPGAKEKKISAVATVPATASTSATPDHAVVLVFVDQAITMGDDAPTQTNSTVQVTLDRVGNRWLISAFDPK